MTKIFRGIPSIEKRSLKNRMFSKSSFYSIGKYLASSLLLKITVSTNMISIRMCIDYSFKIPVVFFKYLSDFSSSIFIISTVYEIYIIFIDSVKSNFCWRFYIISIFPTCINSYITSSSLCNYS